MALDPSNRSNVEQLVLKGIKHNCSTYCTICSFCTSDSIHLPKLSRQGMRHCTSDATGHAFSSQGNTN